MTLDGIEINVESSNISVIAHVYRKLGHALLMMLEDKLHKKQRKYTFFCRISPNDV